MRDSARLAQRLAHEQPARARLNGHVHLPTREPPDPPAHGVGIRRDPPAAHLPRLAVKGIESDLRSVHVEPGYDRHWGLL